jgi:hypothetical protein
LKKTIEILLIAAAMGGGLCLQCGCGGPSQAKAVPFQGTWTFLEENGITKQKAEAVVEVAADKSRFKTVSKSEDRDSLGVTKREETAAFDGESIFFKGNSHRELNEGNSDSLEAQASPDLAAQMEPKVRQVKADKAQLKVLRFWIKDDLLQNLPRKGAGERIADRDTEYFEGKVNRPDGDITLRVWADKENGIILRAISTI